MAMKLYNTLSRSLEEFKPLHENKVKIYHCGPTVYWVQQIGNMRAMFVGDSVRRVLQYLGYDVTYVRNYTDFGHLVSDQDEGEDKMEKGAKREGLSAKEIAEKYIKIFDEDVAMLNTLQPTHSTRATEYIPEMIDIVKDLLQKGYAYSTPEAIYFDISKFPDYTKLSGQKLENLLKGAGHGESSGEHKKNSADFALWFFKTGSHANTSLYWDSPFESPLVENGVGTPGWHVECSAMSIAKLGKSMDIHMGGVEHIPIHHTNEIAQSEAYTGKPFVKYWLHNEHLTVGGEKMSKSQGTAYSMKDIVEHGYDPMHLRYLFIQAHYRSKQDFTWGALDAAKTAYTKLFNRLGSMDQSDGKISEKYMKKFLDAIGNDFNLAQGLAVVWDLLGDNEVREPDKHYTIIDFDRVLGLNLHIAMLKSDVPIDVQMLLDERRSAKESKNYSLSDELRDKIKKYGYEVKDTSAGQIINKI